MSEEFVEIPMNAAEFRLIAASVLEGLAQDAARIGSAKGFDHSMHRTQITLVATEIAEALEHVSASKSYGVDLASVKLVQCMEELRQYQRDATDHRDQSRIGNRAKMIEELADVVLRVLTYVGGNGWSQEFAAALLDKNDANRDRPRLHAKAF
jgi:NTP pyrophosphatase (non-canonical NTP hydrolase)